MIRMVITDIDGTLVKDGSRTLPPELVKTIGGLLDRGVYFVAASGRSKVSMERLFGPLKERIYYAACNGTLMGSSQKLPVRRNVSPKVAGVEKGRRTDPYMHFSCACLL